MLTVGNLLLSATGPASVSVSVPAPVQAGPSCAADPEGAAAWDPFSEDFDVQLDEVALFPPDPSGPDDGPPDCMDQVFATFFAA